MSEVNVKVDIRANDVDIHFLNVPINEIDSLFDELGTPEKQAEFAAQIHQAAAELKKKKADDA